MKGDKADLVLRELPEEGYSIRAVMASSGETVDIVSEGIDPTISLTQVPLGVYTVYDKAGTSPLLTFPVYANDGSTINISQVGAGSIKLTGLPEKGSTVYVIGADMEVPVVAGMTYTTITGIASGTYWIGVKNADSGCGPAPVSFTVE